MLLYRRYTITKSAKNKYFNAARTLSELPPRLDKSALRLYKIKRWRILRDDGESRGRAPRQRGNPAHAELEDFSRTSLEDHPGAGAEAAEMDKTPGSAPYSAREGFAREAESEWDRGISSRL